MDPKNKARLEAEGNSVQSITPELAARWGTLMSPGQMRGQSKPPAPEGQPSPASPSNRLNNEKDGKAGTGGDQVEMKKTNKHITIRQATEEDYRKLQHWNVGTFYRVIQSDGNENMPGFNIGPKGQGKTKSLTPEASPDGPIYTHGFAIGEKRSRPSSKVTEEEATQKGQLQPAPQELSQSLKSGSGKVKRSRDRNIRQN